MTHSMLNPTLVCKRIAVQPRPGAVWEWFSPAVHYTVRDRFGYVQGLPPDYYANQVLECYCQQAIAQYPITQVVIVEVPSADVYERFDMTTLSW